MNDLYKTPDIDTVTLHRQRGPEPMWLGVAAAVGDGYPGDGWQHVKLPTGWVVSAVFGSDNMGDGFGGFWATHSDFPGVQVFGDYGEYGPGVLSESREALERFVSDHPPYHCD